MRFAEPHWLLLGAVVVVLLFALRVRAERLTGRAIETLSGSRLLDAGAVPSRLRRWLRVVVVCVAVAAGFVALARPQQGKEWQTLDRKGTDLLLVIDTSKSMNTDDVSPSRLERTKLAARDLVARFPGDRIGLLAFAGDAYLESPLTLDHGALLETLGTLDTSIIARPGTDIGRAIDSAVSALKAGSQKLVVLLSDGEDLQGHGLEAARRAAEAGVVIHTVGVGTPAGELVPQKNERGATIGVLRDESGNPVRSRLDESGLRAIAQAAHGTYRPLGADGNGLERLYAEALSPLAHFEHGAKMQRVYREWFALPLSLSLLGIALDALLGFRRRAASGVSRRRGSAKLRQIGAIAGTTLLAFLPRAAHASVQTAEKAYKSGKFAQSAREYAVEQAKQPKDARIAIDAGAAAYRAGHFDVAEAALGKALTLAEPKLQERVLYDLGDARYRLGATTLKDAPEKTIERWKAAIGSYEGALKLNPKDADAKYNRDFVERKLAELERQRKNEPPPPKQGGGQNQQDKKGGGANQNQSGRQGAHDRAGGGDQSGKSDQSSSPSQSGQGANPSPKSGSPGAPQPPKNGNEAPKPGQQNAPGGPGEPRGPAGAPPNRNADQANASDQVGKDGAAGALSPRDARSLLDSLRGEERHVRFGNARAEHDDDQPQKDW